jgi:hypothetical protein
MCGIFGIINGTKSRTAEHDIRQYMENAIVANSLRGMDSTGMFQMKRNGKVFYHKKAMTGAQFIDDQTTTQMLTDTDDCRFTVVHNRAATKGAISDANAHPFQHINDDGDYVIGVHNGTLVAGWEKDKGDIDFQVDSDWAINQIANLGVDEGFKKIVGPSAFAWYSPREGEVLNLFRNAGRPMYVAYVKNEDRMLFASEYMMMEWLADRNTILLEDRFMELEPTQLYQFNLNSPREFSKRFLNGRAAAPSTPLPTRSQEDSFFEKVEKIFAVAAPTVDKVEAAMTRAEKKSAKKEAQKAFNETKALTVIGEEPKHKKPKAIIVVTHEEQRLARAAEIMSEAVVFYPDFHDSDKQEAWGTATGDGELWSAVVRRVDTARYQELKKHPWIGAKIIGAMRGEGGKIKDLCVVLSHRSLTFGNTSKSEPEATADNNALAEALRDALATHVEEKAARNNETIH